MMEDQIEMARTLEHLAQWFVPARLGCLTPVAYYNFGPIRSLVIYRSQPFQIELFFIDGGDGFPREHRHPDVDSIEIALFPNEVPFILNGEEARHQTVSVGAEDWHTVGATKGGAFYSVQHWKRGVFPSSVGLNWEGTPVSDVHLKLLRQAGAKWIKTVRK